ncbi:MAG: DUF1573 domain-containing protein [Kiritimatiellae bacterium]|nr:DUF1573 domain-containing protein [Kiritimatiellia bacterium]
MKAFTSFVLLLLLLPLIAFSQSPPAPAITSTPPADTTAALAPKIVCPETVYDFGERESDQVVEHHFVVRNEGTLSLEIRNVRASCGCTAVKPTDNVVPPGGETTIQVRFNLRGRNGRQIKTIFVQSNDPETPNVNLQIQGTIVQGLRAQPATLFFGRVEPGAQRMRPFEILSGRGPVQILEVGASQDGMIVTRLDPEPGDDGTRHRFELTLDDTLPNGTLNGHVVVKTDQGDGREITIPVAAYLQAPPAPPAAP